MYEDIQYKSSKLKKSDIADLVTMYETGNYNQDYLSKKFNISKPTIVKILKATKATKGVTNAEVMNKVKKQLDEEYDQEKQQYQKDVKTTKNESLLWARMVGMAIGREVQSLIKSTAPAEVEEIGTRIRVLKDASTGLNNVMQQRWKALDMDENQEQEAIPSLIIEDLTEEKLQEIHKKTRFQNQMELADESEEDEENKIDLEKLKMEMENDG